MEQYTETEVRRAQIVYLKEVLGMAWDKIAEITGYAVSTVKNYARKFADLLDYAKSIFGGAVEKVVNVVAKNRRSKYDEMIDNFTTCDIKLKDGLQKCYLFKFLDSNNELVYSKVGTTTDSVRNRLTTEIRDYRKSGYDIARVEIDRVWYCGELPAEGLESLIRSEYIKQYPKAFKKNDRFINTLFDLSLCDKIAKNYLEMA